ncbi:uncharacterized protein LOC112517639 [Cynara cardunculus var. scolymus]
MALILFLGLCLLLQVATGEIMCDELAGAKCSFSIASSGKRCVLENYVRNNGNVEYQCKTSEIHVKNMKEWIESDECTNACGVDRMSVGISSDSLLDPRFLSKICSSSCYENCPNIVDLYHNLAIGEGVFLSNLCDVQRRMPRHAMTQLLSSGAASAPTSAAMAEAPMAEAPCSNT